VPGSLHHQDPRKSSFLGTAYAGLTFFAFNAGGVSLGTEGYTLLILTSTQNALRPQNGGNSPLWLGTARLWPPGRHPNILGALWAN